MSISQRILKFVEYWIHTKGFQRKKTCRPLGKTVKGELLSYLLWSKNSEALGCTQAERWTSDCRPLQRKSKMQVAPRKASLMCAEDRILTLDSWKFSESFSIQKNKGFYRKSQLRRFRVDRSFTSWPLESTMSQKKPKEKADKASSEGDAPRSRVSMSNISVEGL